MAINYAERQTISAVEMGWSGIAQSGLILVGTPENPQTSQINDAYVTSLEQRLKRGEGKYLKELVRIPYDIGGKIQALTNICFRDALHVLEHKLREVLDSRYDYAISGGVPGEAVYRDPKTKELVKVSGNTYSKCRYELGKTIINVWSTSPETAKRLLINSIKGRSSESSLDTENIVLGLEDLTSDAQPHGTIYWDEETKGLIKISPGYNLQIPEYKIETTSELDMSKVMTYLRKHLHDNKIEG